MEQSAAFRVHTNDIHLMLPCFISFCILFNLIPPTYSTILPTPLNLTHAIIAMLSNALFKSIMQDYSYTFFLPLGLHPSQLTFVVLIPRSSNAFLRPAATCVLLRAVALRVSIFSSTKSLIRARSWPGVAGPSEVYESP